jgi:hypothetical protein
MTSQAWRFDLPADKPNPFETLSLSIDATNAEIVERVNELIDTADDEGQRLLYRAAGQEQLLQHPLTRVAYELFEVPGASYRDREWEQFARGRQKNPIKLADLARECPPPGLNDFDFAALIDIALEGLLLVPAADIIPAVEHNPFSPHCGPPLEVRDVIFG